MAADTWDSSKGDPMGVGIAFLNYPMGRPPPPPTHHLGFSHWDRMGSGAHLGLNAWDLPMEILSACHGLGKGSPLRMHPSSSIPECLWGCRFPQCQSHLVPWSPWCLMPSGGSGHGSINGDPIFHGAWCPMGLQYIA
jgi:hypothetical protein